MLVTIIQVNATQIQKLDVNRELDEVADLIELCFGSQMDADGWRYLRNIRRAANDRELIRWIPGCGEHVSYPLFGYVWKEDDKIIGNLSLIPIYRENEWRYLIANVAVHPLHRRRGIGKQLTIRALRHIREHNVASAWLQVRDNNPGAIQLYKSLGFVERARRTTWVQEIAPKRSTEMPENVQITARLNQDWEQQSAWLTATYPREVSWNLQFERDHFAPTMWKRFIRILNGEETRQWAARTGQELLGVGIWEPTNIHSDTIWIAANPLREEKAVLALLTRAREQTGIMRPLSVNYPAGKAEEAFQKAGYDPLNTLIWMEQRFKPAY